MAELTNEYLDETIKSFITDNPTPFLSHLDYFKKDGEITACSIGDRWSELSGESGVKTYIKGKITIIGANNNDDNYINGTCPYKHSYQSEDMMHVLKHPCDTGIVNNDGSINIETLKKVIMLNFEYDKDINSFSMRESKMNEFLQVCKERDEGVVSNLPFYMPPFKTVAKFEWYDFYYNFCDRILNDENAVTLNTFLQFYFKPNVLYGRKLNGELPINK